MSQITIRAKVNEKVTKDGVGYPDSVTVTGADALSADTVREIAQEAINSQYGTYESGRIVSLGYSEWERIRNNKAPVIPVVRSH